MASAVPYLFIIASALLLHFSLSHLQPSSPYRLLMLPLIFFTTLATAITVIDASAFPSWNTFIGCTYGPNLALQAIDHVCITRRYLDPDTAKKLSATGKRIHWLPVPASLVWTVDVIYNNRRVGSSHQTKNVPCFNRRSPTFRPSRTQFLIFRSVRFVSCYLLIDLLTSIPPPPATQFSPEAERFLTKLLAGEVKAAECAERASTSIAFWVILYVIQLGMYDLFSIVAIGLGLSNVEDWPPRFGSIAEAYSVRRFWGVFWHQDLRQVLTSNSSFIVHQICRLPRSSIVARYANVLCAFFLSGVLHIISDLMMRVSFWESNTVLFFSAQTIGIMVEDLAQEISRRISQSRKQAVEKISGPPLWQKVVGFAWVALFLFWSTPFWCYPLTRHQTALEMPVRFF